MREVPRESTRQHNRLERFIAAVSPGWAVRREIARRQLGMLASGYRATNDTRLQRSRDHVGGAADDHVAYGRLWKLREKSRDLERDNALASGVMQTFVDNVIGTGHTPQALTDDETWNDEAEAWFMEWALTRADARGTRTFWEMQRTDLRSVIRDGDIGTIMADGCLQDIEADRIGTPGNESSNGSIINGVEINAIGRPLRYFVCEENPLTNSYPSGKMKSINAADFIHLYRPDRVSQTRGIPQFAPVIDAFDRLDSYLEAVIIASQMAACFALVIKKEGAPLNTFPTTAESNANTAKSERTAELEPGAVIDSLRPGEDVVQIKPEHPQQNMPELIDTLARFCVRHLGLPLELGFLNFSHSNFSNTRAALLQAYRTFEGWQKWYQDHKLRAVWRYAIKWAVAHNELPAHPQAMRHSWTAPGWVWVDPESEMKADVLGLQWNIVTLDDVCRKRGGRPWKDRIEQRGRERKAEQTAGVAPSISNIPSAPQSATPTTPADEGEPK